MATKMRLVAVIAILALTATVGAAAPLPSPPAVLDRVLHCTLGRAKNLDPSRQQKMSEIKFEGRHSLSIRLPVGNIRPGPAPDPGDEPLPVDPQTRILNDPDGLMRDSRREFYRVVDLWPKRVEMVTIIDPPYANLLIINPIDTRKKTAWLYLARTADAASVDLARVFQGPCSIVESSTG